MNDGSLKTLFYPFEAGVLDGPGEDARVLFLNAVPAFRLPEAFPEKISLQQEFRPLFRALEASGHTLTPQPDGDNYDLTMILAGRHRGQNELWIAEALRRTRPGGRIVVAGGKTDGAASLRKRISSIYSVDDHASKNHGVVFWMTRGDDVEEAVSALEAANPPLILDGGYLTVPGIFSHEHVDAGSLMLADNLPADIKGHVADFGAGWGYLSVRLALASTKVTSIDLFDASFSACIAAKANMSNLAANVESRVQWYDLLEEKPENRYDAIIMNPPFHQTRAAEPSIGEGMIKAAAASLKLGGRLFMVANRTLAYEPVLQASFARSGEIVRDGKFKILWAVR